MNLNMNHRTILSHLPITAAAIAVCFSGVALADQPLRSRWASTTTAGSEAKALVRTYEVSGMSCEGCTKTLVSHLEDQDQVTSATVSFKDRAARVTFKRGITAKEADAFMSRVSKEWNGAYKFAPTPND